ncbi:MAG: hypothetical protein IT383_01895 [Deltaproteobacteria bacterium]|nr:hypothetical protein [Deltaproteobacteria bacterium]
MASLRRALLLFVCAATAGAAVVGYLVLGGTPARLIVDAALLCSLALIVWMTLTPTVRRMDQMIEALRGLARGDRHQRVNADEFAGLADLARGLNEVAASLTEHEDANLGPVHAKPRLNSRPTHIVKPGESGGTDLGQVRVHKRTEPLPVVERPRTRPMEPASDAVSHEHASAPPASAAASSPPVRAPSEPPVRATSDPPRARELSAGAILSGDVGEPRVLSKPNPILAPPAGTEASGPLISGRPTSAAPTNDTAIDGPRAQSDVGGNGSDAPVSMMPTRAELEALFAEFVTAKKGRDESVSDLDLEAFTQTIQGECERLVQAHACKGVRFEVTEQDGEVSLRPRLIR